MSEKTKSLCAKIPESLHAKVREKQTQTDKGTSDLIRTTIKAPDVG